MTEYTATHRRPARVLILLLLSLLWLGGWVWLALSDPEQSDLERILITGFAGAVLGILLAVLQGFRRHHWQLAPEGIHIRESPRVPFTGRIRRGFVAWTDITELERSGQDAVAQLRVIARDGQSWSMTQRAVSSKQSRLQVADPAALLDDLEATIRTHIAQQAPAIGQTVRGLAFLETGPGIALLVAGLLISIAIAGATGWALWEGERVTTGTRASHDALALFLFGPILMTWGLIANLRRRRSILRARAQLTSAGSS